MEFLPNLWLSENSKSKILYDKALSVLSISMILKKQDNSTSTVSVNDSNWVARMTGEVIRKYPFKVLSSLALCSMAIPIAKKISYSLNICI